MIGGEQLAPLQKSVKVGTENSIGAAFLPSSQSQCRKVTGPDQPSHGILCHAEELRDFRHRQYLRQLILVMKSHRCSRGDEPREAASFGARGVRS